MKNTCYIWSLNLTLEIFLTKCEVEDLVKMDKCPSKWSWFTQIGHIEWIGFSQIDHLDLTLGQIDHICHNLSFGFVTKARFYKVTSQKGSLGIAFHAPGNAKECEGVNPHTPKWILTLPSELPLWKLKFQMDPESLEGNYRGQNPLVWSVIYIIEKLLKHKCLKWAYMTHLDI